MKIICVGRNYGKHAKELGNAVPKEPVLFLKPDTALLKNGQPFYKPAFSSNLHYEAELVVKICKNGKHIQPAFAHKYFEEVALGVDVTARDLQQKQKEQGLPWEIAKAFDNSAIMGSFFALSSFNKTFQDLQFTLKKNGETVQKGKADDMIFSIESVIAYASQFFSLKQGDLIFTGTPEGVGPMTIGDEFSGTLEGENALNFMVK